MSDFREILKDTFAVVFNHFFLQHSVNFHVALFLYLHLCMLFFKTGF